MKTIDLPAEGLTVERLLREAAQTDVVFVTTGGEVRYALVPADESDREVLALRSNPEFISYLTDAVTRAKNGPRKTLAAIREQFGLGQSAKP